MKPALDEPTPRRGLLRVLGLGFGVAVTMGGTIGMGILRAPGEVAAQLGNTWAFLGIWALGGLYALLGAVSVPELGAMSPRSGGFYIPTRRAFGKFVGFAIGWNDWLAACGTTGAIAVVIGENLEALVPVLAGWKVAMAAAAVVGFALLQWRGIRAGSWAQELTSILKGLAFGALMFWCFVKGGNGANSWSEAPTIPLGFAFLPSIVLASQSVIYTYDGWYNSLYFAGEVRDPGYQLPRSMIGGVVLVMTIYLFFNLALLNVVSLADISKSPLAVGVAAQRLFGDSGQTAVAALATVSMLSTINADNLLASRILYALSRDGLFPRFGGNVNPGGTPTGALAVSVGASLLFVFSRKVEEAMAILAFFFVINYAVAYAAVFVLRWREPQAPRSYRAWGYPWTTGLALLGSVAFLTGAAISDPVNSLYALGLLGASVPVYFLLLRSETEGD